MADNTVLSTNVGTGDTIRTEDRTTFKTPVSLIDVGGTSAESIIGDSGVAMPVRGLAAEDAAASGNPVPAGGRYDSTPRSLEDGDRGEIALTSAGHQYAEISASALPSGAATSAKQDTGNTSLSSIDGKITACNTGAVVVSSSALPSGASTAAKQPALGTAGTASADVITIQGIASMTAVKVDGSGVTQPVSDGGSTLSIDDGGNTITVDNGGTFVVQENGAALTALQVIDNPVLVDDAAFTPATSSVMMAGFQADESSTDSINEGDAGAARITLDRKQIVTVQPHTSGGVSTFKSNDIDETEEDVKTSAGQVYWIYCVNTNASARYLKVYDSVAASVTVGSTATKMDLLIPPSNSGFFLQFNQGVVFSTGICVAATTGLGDSDTGAPGANEVQVTVGYM